MELCRAPAQELDIRPIGRESLIDRRLGLGERCGLELALQHIERPCPSIALIFDEALQNGNKGGTSIGPKMLDPTEQGGRVAEVRLRQKTSNLYLDADTSLQPPIELEHDLVAEDQRAVALLGTNPADVPCVCLGLPGKSCCRMEFEPVIITQ